MNSESAFCWSVAICVASIAGCVASVGIAEREKEKMMTAQQMCVARALTNSDRVDCLKVKP